MKLLKLRTYDRIFHISSRLWGSSFHSLDLVLGISYVGVWHLYQSDMALPLSVVPITTTQVDPSLVRSSMMPPPDFEYRCMARSSADLLHLRSSDFFLLGLPRRFSFSLECRGIVLGIMKDSVQLFIIMDLLFLSQFILKVKLLSSPHDHGGHHSTFKFFAIFHIMKSHFP